MVEEEKASCEKKGTCANKSGTEKCCPMNITLIVLILIGVVYTVLSWIGREATNQETQPILTTGDVTTGSFYTE